ncbi:NTP transferase domain-containing protein [Nitrosopumilus maritimus]|uniref:Sugar nucleotidyltransferase-like protein n=1 Tax=Nitrosopumilus maritimus (strain SCM1) TaxID=436308 RepID=A9A1T4_NITMS|nr:phosphocholine cytidylyltransferase family protein [Nitrosopumilus maritimus]ABX12055.1 sugar nucleotidyltransferase-like protein [Nitrosopumilus maritimus SCM1]
MKVIIIAAGKGQRISKEFKEIPKSLIPVNGKTILERQIKAFESNNISEIIVISGKHNQFDNKGMKIVKDFENEKHDILGSLMVAKNFLQGEVIILYSDIIFDENIIHQILNTTKDIAIAIDLDWKKSYEGRTEHPFSEAENVLLDKKNNIVEIKKNIQSTSNIVGEFLGIIKMSEHGTKVFLEKIDYLQKNHTGKFHNAVSLEKGYLTDMIQELINNSIQVSPIFISGKWCEIDTKQDLNRAEELFK